MRLTIEHLAKIVHAELEFNGIAIVAGENNTGKARQGRLCDTNGVIAQYL